MVSTVEDELSIESTLTEGCTSDCELLLGSPDTTSQVVETIGFKLLKNDMYSAKALEVAMYCVT